MINKLKNGTTLVELMIAVTLIGIIAIGLIGSFSVAGKAIHTSKLRTLANNLAQEQIQILKQKSFNKILVTTSTLYLTQFSPQIPYDNGYYPPESILEGGIRFTRYTYVQVVDENSGNLQYFGSIPDTGMKAILVSVVWNQGTDVGKVEVRNLVANIDTTMTNAAVKGLVARQGSGAAIPNAYVTIIENTGYNDTADSSGNYIINLNPGSYSMVAMAYGYNPGYAQISVAANSSITQNFSLSRISTGAVQGTAWINDHLVISQICGSSITTGGFEQEWVEIFNPTTFSWTINGEVGLNFQRPADALKKTIDITYLTNQIAPGKFYLFANTTTVSMTGAGVQADAIWNCAGGSPNTVNFPYFLPPNQLDIISSRANGGTEGAGALELYEIPNGIVLDQMGWDRSASFLTAPFYEGASLAETIGLEVGEQYLRICSTSGFSSTLTPSYDSDNNNVDWIRGGLGNPVTQNPRNSLAGSLPIVAGAPAVNAYVTANDGLSQVTSATVVGSPPFAQFTLANMATGTWTVYIDVGKSFVSISTVVVNTNSTTFIPNATTIPAWPLAGTYSAFLSSDATQGYIMGWVKSAVGLPISIPSGITVTAGGVPVPASTTNGLYWLPITPGTYEVVANPGNQNSSYISVSSQDVVVQLGQVKSNVNFNLSQGGRIRGFVTRDGTNALPGVAVVAMNINDVACDQEVSGSDGFFLLTNLATGTYMVEPVLGSGEVASPTSISTTVVAGSTVKITTFTITGAFGTLKGNVTASGKSIQTGVLIIATTATISGIPPTLSANTLTGAGYYVVNSYEDGSYSLDVRGSTTTKYNVYAYYPTISAGTVSISAKSQLLITVTPGLATSGVNFSW